MSDNYDILLLDNYDSFTYNLYDYWMRLGVSCKVIRNDELSLEAFKALNFKALVLSPGPQKPKDAGLLMPMIEHFYDKKPIFGICLGHQGIGEFFGATLLKNSGTRKNL
jgi:anthranilate synthase component 2